MEANKAQALNQQGLPDLHHLIIQGIQEKKGARILSIDLRSVSDSICDYFVVCHGDSPNQVRAIAEEIMRWVKENREEKPVHKEGFDNLEWVLLDYFHIVVHVFLRERREFYKLEELWSDGLVKEYKEGE